AECSKLAQIAPDRGGLLQAVPTEAIGEPEVADLRVRPEYGVLIECIVRVVACPCGSRAQCLERRHALCQRRPDDLLEQRRVDIEILAVGIRFRADAADELIAFRTK